MDNELIDLLPFSISDKDFKKYYGVPDKKTFISLIDKTFLYNDKIYKITGINVNKRKNDEYPNLTYVCKNIKNGSKEKWIPEDLFKIKDKVLFI